ncbi:DEAD/DEAH box helicase [Candidatus Woesearchaeota archaeon]|nr:DEAD/DEAH box helicase [Candidatus Woesearchaeota archaeon]
MSFEELGVNKDIARGLAAMKLTTPTIVQQKTIPVAMSGKDVVVRSKTGSGKTFAFVLPILQRLERNGAVQALILAPTRELALQINKEIHKLNPHVKSSTIYGGVSISPQIEELAKWTQVVVGTPGRVRDHLERGTLEVSQIRFCVLDEADRMLDMGFIEDVQWILKQLPVERQTMLFSATMPEEVVRVSNTFMNEPERIILEQDEITVKKIRQTCYGLDQREKLPTLIRTLRSREMQRCIIFCNTKRWADTLASIVERRGFRLETLHSDLSQARRNKVIEGFKASRFQILIATDVAARGLHIDDVSHVINYDLPKNPKDYIHRIGRTGRAGKEGHAISFVTQLDQPLLKNIEREIQMYLTVTSTDGKVLQGGDDNAMPEPVRQTLIGGSTAIAASTGSVWDRMD